MRFYLLAFFCFILLSCYCQPEVTLAKDVTREKSLTDAINSRYQNDISSLKGDYKKYLAELYKQRYDFIKKAFDEDQVITDPNASAYLNLLAEEILKANPSLDGSSLRILFSKAWWPNACSMGEGTIFFNIGLFHRLQNESQAAFVLCHELAHYYLDHGNKSILKYVNTVYSDDFQKKLKSIQKTEYRQNQQLESFAKNLGFRTRRHSREFEQAADSMAIEFMKNTSFDLNETLTCLALLDTADKDKYESRLQLDTRFDFSYFHFKKDWLESDAIVFTSSKEDDQEKAEADSLKTHPDCKTRIEKLTEVVARYNKPGTKKFIVDAARFEQLKQQFDYEVLNYSFENGNVSLCLYYTLEMLNGLPDNAYLHSMVGKCLNEIYSRQKEHQLGKIVDLPGPGFNEEYNRLLHLIQNLRLQEIASLSYYYMKQYQPRFEHDAAFASAWKNCMENFTK